MNPNDRKNRLLLAYAGGRTAQLKHVRLRPRTRSNSTTWNVAPVGTEQGNVGFWKIWIATQPALDFSAGSSMMGPRRRCVGRRSTTCDHLSAPIFLDNPSGHAGAECRDASF